MTPTVVAGLLAEVAWFALLGLVWLATRPPRPAAARPDPAVTPGVHALLTHRAQQGWAASGVDATFADLARRGWLELSAHEVRLGAGDGRALNPAESEVLENVRAVISRSGQQAVPLPSLQEGPGAADGWERFAAACHTLALESGLVERRFSDRTIMLLIVGGGAAGTVLFHRAVGVSNGWALLGILLGSCIVHGVLLLVLDAPVLTRAGAAAATPVPMIVPGPRIGVRRSNSAGWAYSAESGWRQWRVAAAAPTAQFPAWPAIMLAVAAVGLTAALVITLAALGDIITPAVAGYLALLGYLLLTAGALALRLRRASWLEQRELEFRQVNVPVTGQVVRKYEERASGEDNTPEITYFVVLHPAPGLPARLFQVSEQQYESVQEGHSTVRALPSFRSPGVDRFDRLS